MMVEFAVISVLMVVNGGLLVWLVRRLQAAEPGGWSNLERDCRIQEAQSAVLSLQHQLKAISLKVKLLEERGAVEASSTVSNVVSLANHRAGKTPGGDA